MTPDPATMQRIVVIGASGSGKTTLAKAISRCLGHVEVELDALHFRPNWEILPPDEFRAAVETRLAPLDRWVTSGNYSELRPILWTVADTAIWLDYSLWWVMRRLVPRTLKRIVTRENLWNSGNYESWRTQFLSRDSLFLFAYNSRKKHRETYPKLFKQAEYAHLHVLHFRHPQETDDWLASLHCESST